MRRLCVFITVVAVLAIVLSAVACGTSFSRATEMGSDSPQEILAAAFSASNDMTAGSGGFEFNLTVDADESQIPAEEQQIAEMLLDGVSVSGTFAYGNDPMAGDFAVSLELAGQPVQLGMRFQGSGFWLNYAGKWYEMPPEAMQAFAGSTNPVDPKEMERLLKAQGLDPVTWFQDLTVVGEEDLSGVNTIHLSGSPDLLKMLTDVFGLLGNEEFLDLIDPTGEMTSGMMGSNFPPSQAEIEDLMTEVESMLQGLTIDLWVGTDDSQVRKMAVVSHIAPPPGEDPEGLLGIDISGSMWLDSTNQPLAIEAPDSPLPFTDLEDALMEDPGPFGMFMDGFAEGSGEAVGDPQTVF